jgi:hypothetical protein
MRSKTASRGSVVLLCVVQYHEAAMTANLAKFHGNVPVFPAAFERRAPTKSNRRACFSILSVRLRSILAGLLLRPRSAFRSGLP